MKRLISTFAIALAGAALLPAGAGAAHPAQGNFGINGFKTTFINADHTLATQAGSHPFAVNTSLSLNRDSKGMTEGWMRDFIAELPPGFLADVTANPRCSNANFVAPSGKGFPNCPQNTQIGINGASTAESQGLRWIVSPVFNLTPPPGTLARIGFWIVEAKIVLDIGVSSKPPYRGFAASRNTSQVGFYFSDFKTQLWGDPTDPAHDEFRGSCGVSGGGILPGEEFEFEGKGVSCPFEGTRNTKPLFTLPTDCSHPLSSSYEALSWEGDTDAGSAFIRDAEGNPAPLTGCGKLGFHPSITAKPTTKAAQSPTGLDFSLDVKDEGLTSLGGLAQSQIKKAVTTLPVGMTANPSVAEGLETCSEADLARETVDSGPGEGCPEASKVGTVEVESPLVGETIDGALYIAKPYENEFGSLLALYLVVKNPNLGIIVKQGLKVEPDPNTGQLVVSADQIPQLPFSHLRLRLREGGRSPLISPPGCGAYEAKEVLTPWSGSEPIETTSAFQIISGPNEGPCPPGGVPPFHPGFEAGSINNSAGQHSPFYMRLTRSDGEQDMTKFSAILPPGELAKLAGVSKCPEAAIAAAKAKTGLQERANPSCPASSKIGRSVAGAGVGSQLTYVPGSVYLAGPVAGDPLSVVAITPAVAGPFDAGTVVVREALTLNPVTAEAEVDGAQSDPIPHILQGIPLNLRDLRVYVDRPDFTLNPTNCEPSKARATLFGSFLSPLDPSDDVPVGLSSRYQAANCASLGFKPKLALSLKGGTKRGGHPALKAVVTPRPGDANFSKAVVTLPHSAFLDQAHIKTICTRVQFAAGGGDGAGCPADAQYGFAKATSPLLDEPLQGPVFLRSSNHNLPDLVVVLRGLVNVDLAARIDSLKGGIRSTFTGIPDAPVSKFTLEMQGGKKGLIVNSRNLCARKSKADASFGGQNGKLLSAKPVLKPDCGGKRKHRRH